ncbi:DNA polymerase III subunit delta [Weissella muntiaci]|uniref:DNA polymerase III subunit delta n=1 Tax=Weissella muntiaci TaxID=2508881 RepID=A0A6C2C1D3_9LACO|nr:DNA polymerase III subunit delta [Weissella muntiaci]TYC47798.1 DNA polymerase III subunit delta [Weissella muntiaci]
MAVTLDTIKAALGRNEHAPIYLIQGTDQYLLDQARMMFTNLIDPADQTLNLGQFDLSETPLSAALDDARAVPFFGEFRVVILDNAYFLTGENSKNKIEHNPDEMLEYLQHPEPQTILVIFAPYSKLDSRKKVVKQLKERTEYLAFGDLTERDIQKMIYSRLEKENFKIEKDALEELIRLTNMSLTQIMSELDKLSLYAADSKVIDLTAVEALVTRTLSENIFNLIENLLAGSLTKAVQLYHELVLSGEEPLRLHAALVGQFRLLIQVKSLQQSEQAIAGALKVHPYRVKLAKKTVRNFSFNALSKAYLGLVAMEEQLKSTQRDPELLFELFVLRYQHDIAG